MPTPDPATRDHKAWLGYVQQEGLVVSPAALVDAQVVLDRNTLPMQERFLPFVKEVASDGEDPVPAITDFPAFARGFLQWPEDCLHGLDPARPLPNSLTVALQEGESISPSFAFNLKRAVGLGSSGRRGAQVCAVLSHATGRIGSGSARCCHPRRHLELYLPQ